MFITYFRPSFPGAPSEGFEADRINDLVFAFSVGKPSDEQITAMVQAERDFWNIENIEMEIDEDEPVCFGLSSLDPSDELDAFIFACAGAQAIRWRDVTGDPTYNYSLMHYYSSDGVDGALEVTKTIDAYLRTGGSLTPEELKNTLEEGEEGILEVERMIWADKFYDSYSQLYAALPRLVDEWLRENQAPYVMRRGATKVVIWGYESIEKAEAEARALLSDELEEGFERMEEEEQAERDEAPSNA